MTTIPLLFGPYGSAALQFARDFNRYQANAAWFHGFDPQAFEQCARYDLAACVEFKTFRTDFNEHPECVPIGVDGQPIRYGNLVQGVCLSQQDFLAETEASLLAGLEHFRPAGIWLDYLTYAGWFETPDPDLQENCFCPDCIADFCEACQVDAASADEILSHHALAWERHKCRRVAAYAARYVGLIRQHHPDCVVGAYMCPWTPQEFDRALTRIFAQDYGLLAESIDIFTPLIYAHKSGRNPAWSTAFMEAAPAFVPAERPIQLILDVLDFPASLQALLESPSPGWGLQLFGGARVLSDPAEGRIFAQAVEKLREKLEEQGI